MTPQSRVQSGLVWAVLAAGVIVPLVLAMTSPLLAWRDPIYIAAGFAGIVGLALLLVQPLLIGGLFPGLSKRRSRAVHRWAGFALLCSSLVHVAGLWITSPPDMIDALLFASPTPFSAFGVVAMWGIFALAFLVALRRRLRPKIWRSAHLGVAAIVIAGAIIHVLLIEGTMEPISKVVLCGLVVIAAAKVMLGQRRSGP